MNNHQNYVPFRINRGKPAMAAAISAMLFAALAHAQTGSGLGLESSFHRVATFPVFLNTCEGQPDSCIGEETVAEIVAASKDGNLLIYTDAASEKLGFVDITKASDPKPAGVVSVDGSPTSVAVAGDYALVGVDTTSDLASPSGTLKILHIPTRTLIRTIDIGGQPDSVAVSPDGRYAAIAIENQRNEDLCVGGSQNGTEADEDECEDGGGRLGWLPQLPAGFLVIVDLAGAPANWTTREVDLTGIATLYPSDPEPEFVDINAANVAAVTLQENNHVVLVHLPTGQITGHFSARSVDLTQIDTDDNGLIEPSDKLTSVLREPDAVVWTSLVELATANEGDLAGGSRGFTIFGKLGDIRFDSSNAFEHLAMRVGHYPEGRSDNKGNETEGLAYGEYGNQRLLFAGSERSSIIAVYRLPLSSGPPQLVQVLPANVGPEGLLAIPQRNLFVAASENDDRAGTFRSTLTIYELRRGDASYPTILSANGPDGLPIPWGALSGIAADPVNPNKAYTIYDSFFRQSRIYTVDAGQEPALITDATDCVTRSGTRLISTSRESLPAKPAKDSGWSPKAPVRAPPRPTAPR